MRFLPVVLAFALTVYCLFDIRQTDPRHVRTLSRRLWALVVLVPFVGALAWFLSGRPGGGIGPFRAEERPRPGPPGRRPPRGPDDDPDFLRGI
ncbi:PLDc N-terminal domain-containing protein [Phycicoccus sp. BSK3Z-2]|uniref:PLDc N-terminal domain-containing protein n=1 Tax=Phycicoccus avicenniae TaxID=2828860 RepID=A0A941D7L6_9MICO|nr:PLDc N-terminal domain-containing protein [Phycicoccus avicenniae]MBR7743290.1 PLDc N-terminal domain-containing protein [Phycicoccus avicenniae]